MTDAIPTMLGAMIRLAIIAAAWLSSMLPAVAGPSAQSDDRITYGVYDPERAFSNSDRIGIEHVFISWLRHDPEPLRKARDYAASRNRWLMVTIEPWSRSSIADTLLRDVAAGRYDRDIAETCAALGKLDVPLFLRWGHEMEDVTGRYPWAQTDAEGFVRAYRHFVEQCRRLAPHAFFVWSPKGRPQMGRYYPGPDDVDYVGLSVYGLEQADLDAYGKPLDFNGHFADSYERAARYAKPVMIAELGINGDANYLRQWMDQVARARYKFPGLRAVVYFNARDPAAWPGKYGAPDWRIDPALFPDPFSQPPTRP